jgi:3-hydroxyisobutyrate dehydrogenase-like beta-hydroxyacid dehydrogenase
VPGQFKDDGVLKSAMAIVTKDVGIVMDEARMLRFPAPLSAAAEQLFTAATGAGMARIDDCFLIRLWKNFGVNIQEETGTAEEESAKAKELDVKPVGTPKVLFVGLGAMGAGMAASVLKAGIDVVGYDVRPEAAARFGGKTTNDPVSAAKDATIAVLVPVTAAQADDILFAGGVAAAMPKNGVIVLCSTIAPSAALKIQAGLDKLQRGLKLIDAPVSGGPSRANIGDLAVMASGDDAALAKACSVLQAMATQAGNTVNLHFIRECFCR